MVESKSRKFLGWGGSDLLGVAKDREVRRRGLSGAGPGAELSLLVKRQLPSPRRPERQAACPPARPGADRGAAGRGSWVRG